jgi:hypothetical protein
VATDAHGAGGLPLIFLADAERAAADARELSPAQTPADPIWQATLAAAGKAVFGAAEKALFASVRWAGLEPGNAG